MKKFEDIRYANISRLEKKKIIRKQAVDQENLLELDAYVESKERSIEKIKEKMTNFLEKVRTQELDKRELEMMKDNLKWNLDNLINHTISDGQEELENKPKED